MRLVLDNREKTTTQIIRALIGLRSTSVAALAEKLGTSRQNLTGKLNRNNFSEKDLNEIGNALGFKVVISWEEQ